MLNHFGNDTLYKCKTPGCIDRVRLSIELGWHHVGRNDAQYESSKLCRVEATAEPENLKFVVMPGGAIVYFDPFDDTQVIGFKNP